MAPLGHPQLHGAVLAFLTDDARALVAARRVCRACAILTDGFVLDEAIEFVESMRDGEPSAWEQEQYRSGIR